MALELKDFRGRITLETWCVLEAEHLATGREHQAILRDVMHAWASAKIDKSSVLSRLLRGHGIVGEAQGGSGTLMDEPFPRAGTFADSQLSDGPGLS